MSAAATLALPSWPSSAQATGVRPRPLVFPRDHGAHPDTRTEWWYITGELHTGGPAPSHGFQVTFFRSRTRLAAHPSRFAARQLLFAHAAVTDLSRATLWHDQRIARAGFGIAQAAETDTRLVLRDWTLQRQPSDNDNHRARYTTRVHARQAGFAFELAFDTTQPLLLQGDAGYSRKGPDDGQASHYYSQPQMRVSGRLQQDGGWSEVRGRAWLDHEWSDTLMHPQAVGWDWIGMNLDDGGALTAFRLRRADGSSVWGGGSYRAAGSTAPQVFEGPGAVVFRGQREWTSPATGIRYPVDWRVATPAGEFEVRARVDAQELDSRSSTGSVYWEGLSELRDAQGRRVGSGYLEMTGYGERLVL